MCSLLSMCIGDSEMKLEITSSRGFILRYKLKELEQAIARTFRLCDDQARPSHSFTFAQ